MGKLNIFGGDKQETTYNTTQSWYDSYNTTLSSARSLENVGNTTIALPGSGGGAGGSTSDTVILAVVGILLLAALALVFRSSA